MSPWWTKVSGASLQLKASLDMSLQLLDHACAWMPKSLSHLVGLGCKVLRIINSCLELFYSLSLEEPIHLRQGQRHLFSLQAFQTPQKSEGLRILERGDKGLHKSDLYAFKVCKVAGM